MKWATDKIALHNVNVSSYYIHLAMVFWLSAVGVNICSLSLLNWLSAVSRTAVNLLIMSVCFNIIGLPPIYSFFSLELLFTVNFVYLYANTA